MKEFKKVWFAGIPVGLGLGLIMLEPDFGSFVVVSVIAVGLLFLAGLPFRWFMAVVGFGSAVMIILISVGLLLRVDYENRRVMRGFKV